MERLQKVLAQLGYGSRREIESWIAEGKVSVNGKVAELGCKVTESDDIRVCGKKVSISDQQHQVIIYNKPEGEICTRKDPEGRRTVFDSLPKLHKQRWVAVGRLDINSSGLIIFTTDGELANKLMHPKANIERVYAVRVLGDVSKDIIRKVTKGVKLDDGTVAKFTSVKFTGGSGANAWYHVTLTQGRYREVRRIWEAVGLQVSRLIRIKYGDFILPQDLVPGKFRTIKYSEVVKEYERKT